MWNTRLDETQSGIKIAGRNINNLKYSDDTIFTVESKEELKSLLMKVKEECEWQQKRHWCIEQSFGLCGRGREWDDLGEWHWDMYNIIYEMSRQSRFDARYWMLGAGALGRPRGMIWGGRREEGSGWGTYVYLWRIHFNIWQNQYNIVKFKNKIKF